MNLVGAIVLVVVVVAVLVVKAIMPVLRESVVKHYAKKAVAGAEMLVMLAGETKLRVALQWATNILAKKWHIPITPAQLEPWIEWAVGRMKAEGKEIKAETVIPVDHPALKIKKGEWSIGFEKSF